MKKLGNGITTAQQLTDAMKGEKGFIGVFSQSEWAKRFPSMSPGDAAIVNLDANWRRGGTHWVAIKLSKSGRGLLYKDSFGAPPPTRIIAAVGDSMPIYYSNNMSQGINEENCGQRSVYALKSLIGARDDLQRLRELA